MAAKKIPDETQRLLKEVCDHFDKEDRDARERQIRQWKKLKYYWNGFQRIWWSEVAHDWRVYGQEQEDNSDSGYYDKPVNIFKAYLESIIAALSVSVPLTKCFPDDADSPLDLSTARAGDIISKLVYRHNDAPLLWIHALYIYCTEGMIAAYNYTKTSKEYGTYKENQYEDVLEKQQVTNCPECGGDLTGLEGISAQLGDLYDPGAEDIPTQVMLEETGIICPQCLVALSPDQLQVEATVTRLVGEIDKPKARQCIEVHGGLFVKVANYAENQKGTPYLIYAYETHYANVLEQYQHLESKIGKEAQKDLRQKLKTGGMYDSYEQWGRLSTQFVEDYPSTNVTVRNCWLRPSAFNVLEEENTEKLKNLYPDGAKVVLVNDEFADAMNEALDDHWTLTQNPLSDYIHTEPLGNGLVPIQEVLNDLVALIIQTVEHGIPQTFADPGVLNFDQYRQAESTPGMIFPAKPASGRSIGDAFYEIKTANLSGEVIPFTQKMEEAGQLVSGALPSLFGGAQPNSSKTAAQYSMSRQQALQRLQTVWKMLSFWWKDIFGKVIPAYMKDVMEDEKFVEQGNDGNFINVFLRKAELQGKIGSIELESSEQLPVTWQQQKDAIMELMQNSNPEILAALMSPENLPFISSAVGLPEFIIPGEDDRQKQYEEIQQLVSSEPISIPGPPTPENPEGTIEEPSIDIEPLVDNHPLHIEICKRWLVSDVGREAKIKNPPGYKNILLHLERHTIIMQVMSGGMGAPQPGPQQEQQAPQQGNPNAQ